VCGKWEMMLVGWASGYLFLDETLCEPSCPISVTFGVTSLYRRKYAIVNKQKGS